MATMMMDDDEYDDWPEEEMPGRADGLAPSLLAVSYFDTIEELRGCVAEAWQEFDAAFGSPDSPLPLRNLSPTPSNIGLRWNLDAGLECSLLLYPIIDGEERLVWAEATEPLFQLGDDGMGMVDPEHLWAFLEYLLDDILFFAGRNNRDELMERFAGGGRRLALCDPIGCLLVMPTDPSGGGSER